MSGEGRFLSFLSGALLVVSAGATAGYLLSTRHETTVSVKPAESLPENGGDPVRAQAVRDAVGKYLDRPVSLTFGGDGTSQRHVRTTFREMGVEVDNIAVAALVMEQKKAGAAPAAGEAGKSAEAELPTPIPVRLDRTRGINYFARLKDELDRSPRDARIDMEHKTVIAERAGVQVLPYESMTAVETAARQSVSTLGLAVADAPPHTTRADLKNIDISVVMGSYETPYSVAARDSDRTYNLKVAAEKVSGYTLMPGQVFSFNEVVGDRTEKEGYRVAPVIQAGELVDGLAGGACQISTTLHAASFFAGLDIVSTRTHSRPSAYIAMGLDATVVYPTTDLKLRNNFDFPVVFYYQVNQGRVRVEVLGKERPYKVSFTRTITERKPFEIVEREDDTIPTGVKVVSQHGVPGFKILKRRTIFDRKSDKLVKEEKWAISYPPTTEYVRVGTNADPKAKAPPPEPPHAPRDQGGQSALSITQ